jgi:hypothetical protein
VYQAQLRLKRPYGYRSPGAFDYGRWLFVSGYSATGYVRRSENRTKGEASDVFSAQISRYRLIAAPRAHLDRYPNGAITNALLFADRSDISSVQWQLFQQTGTSHLMAISGMHIGMIFLWGWGFGRVAVFFSAYTAVAAPHCTAVLRNLRGDGGLYSTNAASIGNGRNRPTCLWFAAAYMSLASVFFGDVSRTDRRPACASSNRLQFVFRRGSRVAVGLSRTTSAGWG